MAAALSDPKILKLCQSEADAVVAYLEAHSLKQRSSILVCHGSNNTVSVQFIRGVDLHYAILTQAADILKITQTLSQVVQINDLSRLDDSIQLCLLLINLKRLKRVTPFTGFYPTESAES